MANCVGNLIVTLFVSVQIVYRVEGALPTTCSESWVPHPDDCTSYLVCLHGKPLAMPCPSGLHWNSNVKTCDWPHSANCQSSPINPPTELVIPTTTEGYVEPEDPFVPELLVEPTEQTVNHVNPVTSTESTINPTKLINPVQGSEEMKVVCYFTNWAWYRQSPAGKFLPENIDPNLCTHIIYAFSVLDSTSLTIKTHDPWADIDNKFYEKVTAFRKKGIKVLIAIGGWNDSLGDKYGRLLNDPNARRKFIESVMEFIKKYNFDGLDLDLEYPSCWQTNCEQQRSGEKQAFAQLTKELSDAFKPKGWLLSAAVSASKRVIDAGYDVPMLAQYLDWIAIMTYDYHGNFDRKTGHNAPFMGTSDNFDVDFSVNYWMKKGAPSRKLVLGIPSYGQSFTLANAQHNGFNAPSNGAGQAGPVTGANGMLAYYEICEKTKRNGWKVVRDPQNKIGPYAYHGDQWVSFDDVENIRVKGKYIHEKNLGGGMIWALDFDDFTGSCGCGKNPLLTAFNQEIRETGGQKINNCT